MELQHYCSMFNSHCFYMELAYYLNKVKHYFVHHIRIHFFSLRIAEETIQSIKEKEKRDAKKV